MLSINHFTPAQRKIIKAICIFQLESLNRILNNESEGNIDLELYLLQNEVDKEDVDKEIKQQVIKFQSLHDNPDDLRVLSKNELYEFRHYLANLEDNYKDEYPLAISNLWNRLFLIEEIQKNPLRILELN
jgi:hypothetical protein